MAERGAKVSVGHSPGEANGEDDQYRKGGLLVPSSQFPSTVASEAIEDDP